MDDKVTLNQDSTKKDIINNLYWAVLGKVVTLLGSLFVGIIVARYLGPEDYGLMNYVVSYVMLFQIISVFGLDGIEIREFSKGKYTANLIIGTALSIRIVLSVIVVAATILTSFFLESDFYTIVLVSVYAFSIIANSLNVVRNYFTAMMRNKYVVLSEIGRTLFSVSIKLILLFYNAPLIWFIIALSLDIFILALGYLRCYSQIFGKIKEWSFDKTLCVFLIKESWPLLLTSAAVILYQKIDQVFIGQMINKESVGFFAVASRFVDILIYLPYILSDTISPVLVRKRNISENNYRENAQLFMNCTFWLSLFAATLLCLFSKPLVLLLFGEAYMPSVAILQILSFKAAAISLSTTAGRLLVIEGVQRFAIIRDSFGCVVCVMLNIIFLPTYGVYAAAFIAIVSNLCAGYVADLFVPAYRGLFRMQTKTLLSGWKDILKFNSIIRAR